MKSEDVLNISTDAIVYFEAMQNNEIGSTLNERYGWIGAIAFRELCANMASDLSEKFKRHTPSLEWDDFVEGGRIYFDSDMVEVWDFEYCPLIVDKTMDKWLEDGGQLQASIRLYHHRVLVEIFDIASKINANRKEELDDVDM